MIYLFDNTYFIYEPTLYITSKLYNYNNNNYIILNKKTNKFPYIRSKLYSKL